MSLGEFDNSCGLCFLSYQVLFIRSKLNFSVVLTTEMEMFIKNRFAFGLSHTHDLKVSFQLSISNAT